MPLVCWYWVPLWDDPKIPHFSPASCNTSVWEHPITSGDGHTAQVCPALPGPRTQKCLWALKTRTVIFLCIKFFFFVLKFCVNLLSPWPQNATDCVASNNENIFLHSFGVWKSKTKVLVGSRFLQSLLGKMLPYFFQVLVSPGAPWPVVAELRALPLSSSHGCLSVIHVSVSVSGSFLPS